MLNRVRISDAEFNTEDIRESEALQCGSLTIRAPHHTAILSATTVSRAGLGDAAMRFEEAARIWHMP